MLVHLVGPEAIQNGEIYSAANDREQAAQVFQGRCADRAADPELSALCRVVDSTKHIACYSNGSFYKAVSAEAGTKHGLNPSLVIFDELAQARNRELYDVLDTSMGARAEPLFITISTQSNDPEHILSKLIDDGWAAGIRRSSATCMRYRRRRRTRRSSRKRPGAWRNPALGDFRSLDDMRTLAAKAQRMPAEEPKFRNLYLNQRVAPVSSLLTRAEWTACAGGPRSRTGEDVYLALDMSAIIDLSAL